MTNTRILNIGNTESMWELSVALHSVKNNQPGQYQLYSYILGRMALRSQRTSGATFVYNYGNRPYSQTNCYTVTVNYKTIMYIYT